MAEKTKYCEKAIPNSTQSFLNMYDELQKHTKVNPGDIVYLKGRGGQAKTSHGVKLTYKVESVHPTGLVVARKILPNGKYGPTEIINDGAWNPEVDHTFIENIIMKNEDNYDPSVAITELEREKRRVTKYNKSISQKTSDQPTLEAFFQTLKAGDKVWYGSTLLNLKECYHEVQGPAFIKKEKTWDGRVEYKTFFLPVTTHYTYRYGGGVHSYKQDLAWHSLKNDFFTTQEPQSVDDKTK